MLSPGVFMSLSPSSIRRCEEVDRAGMAMGHVPWPMLCEWFASDESEGDEREEEPSDDIPLVARDRRETTLRPSLGRADIDKLGKHPNKVWAREERTLTWYRMLMYEVWVPR